MNAQKGVTSKVYCPHCNKYEIRVFIPYKPDKYGNVVVKCFNCEKNYVLRHESAPTNNSDCLEELAAFIDELTKQKLDKDIWTEAEICAYYAGLQAVKYKILEIKRVNDIKNITSEENLTKINYKKLLAGIIQDIEYDISNSNLNKASLNLTLKSYKRVLEKK